MVVKYCPQCGERVKPADRFCPYCAAPLTEAEQQERGEPAGTRSPARSPRKLPLAVLALAAVGVVLVLAGFLLRDDEPVVQETLPTPVEAGIPFPDVPRISLEGARALHEAGDAVFVDVRDEAAYLEMHIADAQFVPLGDAGLDASYQQLPPNAQIITYCT